MFTDIYGRDSDLIPAVLCLRASVNDNDGADHHDDDYARPDAGHGVEHDGRDPVAALVGVGGGGRRGRRRGGGHGGA